LPWMRGMVHMKDNKDIVIGIDGGGTTTRVMVSDLDGQILSYIEKGAASLHKDLSARDNVTQALLEALAGAGRELWHVRGLAAGIAGYDSEVDLPWVLSLTDVEGLDCPKWHYNDTVAALYGAFLMRPGIVAISGTGSIIAALTESGEYLRNYDFHHYASSAARFIAYEAVYEVFAGNTDESDSFLVEKMLRHWRAESMADFYKMGKEGFSKDKRERNKSFGQFAPAVTEAALRGSSIARRVCDHAIEQLRTGIRLLGASFTGDVVRTAFIGSVINNEYFSNRLRQRLASPDTGKRYEVVNPHYAPVTGSVLFAIRQIRFEIGCNVVKNLNKCEVATTK
jgi:glucosamine kinase